MSLILIPTLLFILILIFRPDKKLRKTIFSETSTKKYTNIDDAFNAKRKAKQDEIDRILDKINTKGAEALTTTEKEILNDYSNTK